MIGSFLTVVVHRLPIMLERAWRAETQRRGSRIRTAKRRPAATTSRLPRSACPHCGHTLRAWENIPVISYVLLRGRCAQCGASVSPRYPLIELATAFFAAASLYAFGPDWLAVAAFGLCAVLSRRASSISTRSYLPDSLTLPLLWAGLIVNLGDGGFVPLHDAVVGAIAGYLFLWCVYWIFRLVRGVEGMGYGDFKLLGALGAWLGWMALPQIVLVVGDRGRAGRAHRDLARAHALRGTAAVRPVSRDRRRADAFLRHAALRLFG